MRKKAPGTRRTAVVRDPAPADGSATVQAGDRLPEGVFGVREIRPQDVTPDDRNANLGTKRGLDLLEESLERYGAGRGVLLDKNRRFIAGNKTGHSAIEKGMRLVEVETDGKTLIAVRRRDLDLDSPDGRGLALADNRVAEVDLLWDPQEIVRMADGGVAVDAFLLPEELDRIREAADAVEQATAAPAADAPAPRAKPKAKTCPKCGHVF